MTPAEALVRSACSGDVAQARALLDAGADPDAAFVHDGWRQAAVYGAAGIVNDAPLLRMRARRSTPGRAPTARRSARRPGAAGPRWWPS